MRKRRCRERLRERDEAERGRAAAAAAREEALTAEQEARQHAEAANRVKDEFLMAVSHELRTDRSPPSSAGRTCSARSNRRCRPPAGDADDRAQRARAEAPLDDLLDVSRYASGKLRLDIQMVSLDAVIQAAMDAIRPSVLAKGLEIRYQAQPMGPVLADGNRLQQVVWNLLANAVKFTPAGGQIDVTLEQHGDGAVAIAVSDSGSGIDAAVMPHVFEPFRQGEKSPQRGGGLGLGLAIVRHLVELHGGTVRAENNESGGARLVVALPAGFASPLVDDAPAYQRPGEAGPSTIT